MDRGGVETWLVEVLRRAGSCRLEMGFLCLGGRPGVLAPEIAALGGRIHLVRPTRNIAAVGREFGRVLRAEGYDIVHSHVHGFSGFLLWRAARAGIRGRIAHSHSTSDGKEPTLLRRAYRSIMRRLIRNYATTWIAASTEAGLSLFGRDWERDPRARIVRYGINVSRFLSAGPREAVRAQLGLPGDSIVVGSAARFARAKNYPFWIQVAAKIALLEPRSRFLLVGDGELRPSIERMVAHLGLEDRFVMTGLRDDVPDLLRAMDVFLMPSLYEGLPVACLEAQAAGVPAVISDAVTPEAAVVPGMVQRLPLDLTPEDWARAVLHAGTLAHPSVGSRETAFGRTGFSIQASVEGLAALYHEIIRDERYG